MGTSNKDFMKDIEEAVKKLRFGTSTYEFTLNGAKTATPEEDTEPIGFDEKWIWVEGYKGTNKDMQGHDNYQFEVGKRYDMPLDVEIEDCQAGFHLSLTLNDVFRHYDIERGSRFFKVRALVRERDFNQYGKPTGQHNWFGPVIRNKLASQSIEFIRELTLDEIFENIEEAANWSEDYKNAAIACGLREVRKLVKADELAALGYSEAFAAYVVKKDRYDIAKMAASQPGLSMDMRALMIMNW